MKKSHYWLSTTKQPTGAGRLYWPVITCLKGKDSAIELYPLVFDYVTYPT
jgi:hypothetical protein